MTRRALAAATDFGGPGHDDAVQGPVPASLAAQRETVEDPALSVEQARVARGQADQEVRPALDDLGQVLDFGVPAVRDAQFSQLRGAAREALGLAAVGDCHGANPQRGQVEDGVHQPIRALVAGWHHGSGVHGQQPLPPRRAHARQGVRVPLGQQSRGQFANGPQHSLMPSATQNLGQPSS